MMPIYEYQCDTCKRIHEVLRAISQCSEPYACDNCGSSTKKLYSFTTAQVFQPYSSAYNNGREITSAKQEKRVLARNGRVLTHETKAWDKIRKHASEHRKKRIYSTPTKNRGSVAHAK